MADGEIAANYPAVPGHEIVGPVIARDIKEFINHKLIDVVDIGAPF